MTQKTINFYFPLCGEKTIQGSKSSLWTVPDAYLGISDEKYQGDLFLSSWFSRRKNHFSTKIVKFLHLFRMVLGLQRYLKWICEFIFSVQSLVIVRQLRNRLKSHISCCRPDSPENYPQLAIRSNSNFLFKTTKIAHINLNVDLYTSEKHQERQWWRLYCFIFIFLVTTPLFLREMPNFKWISANFSKMSSKFQQISRFMPLHEYGSVAQDRQCFFR